MQWVRLSWPYISSAFRYTQHDLQRCVPLALRCPSDVNFPQTFSVIVPVGVVMTVLVLHTCWVLAVVVIGASCPFHPSVTSPTHVGSDPAPGPLGAPATCVASAPIINHRTLVACFSVCSIGLGCGNGVTLPADPTGNREDHLSRRRVLTLNSLGLSATLNSLVGL